MEVIATIRNVYIQNDVRWWTQRRRVVIGLEFKEGQSMGKEGMPQERAKKNE